MGWHKVYVKQNKKLCRAGLGEVGRMNMKECPKCGKKDSWEEGNIIHGGLYGIQNIFRPRHKKFFHTSQSIQSFASKNCGYIESYINPNPFKKTLKD